jgi:DNA repair exonuclease SbcCD ATPase subunit
MKTKNNKSAISITLRVLLVLFAVFMLIGCKPTRIITEKIDDRIDSTLVTHLKNELEKTTEENRILKTNLERTRDEITTLRSTMSVYEINYDTAAVVKPDGYYPIAREVKTESMVVYENKLNEKEKLITELNQNIESLTKQNEELSKELNLVKSENSDLSNETRQTTGFNFRLFFIGVAIGIILAIVGRLLIKKYL